MDDNWREIPPSVINDLQFQDPQNYLYPTLHGEPVYKIDGKWYLDANRGHQIEIEDPKVSAARHQADKLALEDEERNTLRAALILAQQDDDDA